MSRLGRRIAFDYGDVRIGVAICDPDGILATPLTTLLRRDPQLKSQLSALFQEYEPVKIYVGSPKLLSGAEGEAVNKVSNFTSFLTANFDLPIVMVDERLSTVSAQRQLHEAGKSARESKNLIDAAAAVAILEQGLANESK